VKHPGPKTIYALSALATVLLVVAAGLAASGIDIGRPEATDLPLVIARSALRPAVSTIPTAPATAPVTAPQPAAGGESASGGSTHPSATAAKPAAVTPPADTTHHDHEVVTPPVRESDEHKTSNGVTTPKTHD
jgi:hypothetical protein